MACCKDKRDTLEEIEGNIYPSHTFMSSTCGLYFCITSDGALTVIDDNILSGDYFRCAECGFVNNLLLYVYPTLYASYSGKTKYPVKAHRKMLNLVEHLQAWRYIEPNFGTFISGWYYHPAGNEINFIIYRPMKPIDVVENDIHAIEVDNKIAICCVTQDNEVILINSDCEIIETVCVLESEPGIFKIPGGQLKYSGDYFSKCRDLTWVYTSKALNTKPALASQEAS